jgi:hypothetical protein
MKMEGLAKVDHHDLLTLRSHKLQLLDEDYCKSDRQQSKAQRHLACN